MREINYTIKPNAKQLQFLNAKAKYVGFGGARGGGKSWSVQKKSTLNALNHPGIKQLIIRKTYPELYNNHIRQMRSDLLGVAKYNDKEKELRFPNGSIIRFMFCSNDQDCDKLQGTEWDVIYFDEATQLSEYQMKQISATLRGVNDFPKRIYYTCNPGGQGHNYIKRIFIDKKYSPGERPEDYVFIQSFVQDNKALMEAQPDYIETLKALPEKLRKAWLEGNWNVFEGQFFEEFTDDPDHYKDKRFTHVIEPFEVPREWKIYRSFDWGYNKPFDCSWWAVDYDGRAYLILQLYGCTGEPNVGVRQNPYEVFSRIAEIERQHRWLAGKNIHGVADPAIWNSETGESIAEVGEKHRIYFDKGDNSRISGWMQCHYRLQFDEEGIPMVYFFNTCRDAIRTLPLLQYDEHQVEDIDTEMEDHFADSFRYFCMSRPIKPIRPVKEEVVPDDPLDLRNEHRYSRYSF